MLYRKGELDEMGADLEEGASLLPEVEDPEGPIDPDEPRPADVRQGSSDGGSVTT